MSPEKNVGIMVLSLKKKKKKNCCFLQEHDPDHVFPEKRLILEYKVLYM